MNIDDLRFALTSFAMRVRPAVKEWETRCALSVMKWERGEYPPHYEKLLKDEARRARDLFDEVEAMMDGKEGHIAVTDEMVDRFLSWPLPESVCADLCTTESSFYQKRGYTQDHRCGTNLLSAIEARQMLEHVLKSA